MKFLIGKKIGMTQIFDDKGNMVPVTLVEAGPCYIAQKKDGKKDGYLAVQIGWGELKKANKPSAGHLKNSGKQLRYLREFRDKTNKENFEGVNVGDKIDVSVFQEKDKVSVSSVSKGKGFAGMIKRWGASRKPTTHGAKHQTRAMGSVGCRFPQRVVKGRKMPGRLGFDRVSIKNLQVMKIDRENNVLAIRGALPGPRGAVIEIRG